MSRVIRAPRAALAVMGVAALLLAGPAAAAGAKAQVDFASPLFGLATAPDGSLLVADAGQGVVAIKHGAITLAAPLPGITDVGAIGNGSFYATTGLGDPKTGARLWRVSNGRVAEVADLGAFEAAVNPDGIEPPDSNPFDLAVLNGGGVLVADAGGNTVLYVDIKGRVEWVAMLPDELVSTTNIKSLFGCPAGPPDICGLPAEMPGQAVPTAVAIGPDGAAYVSELKGWPAPAGESRIWRIAPGTLHAVCGVDPGCDVIASDFTSIVDLSFGPDGTLYVAEIDEASFMAVELGGAGSTGGTVNACTWGQFPLDCEAIATDLAMPTATTVGGDGTLYATIWSLVPGMADVVRLP